MRSSNIMALLGAAGLTLAQRPSNTSVCDYYTTALLTNNTAANQYTLLTLLVNTVVIGNYTKPNVGVSVPGILAPGTYNGTEVNLLPYFDGMFASSNRGNESGVAVNFLDGGGATPLMSNMPANGTDSNQYKLLTHLYQYFGFLLGCSEYGKGAFPAYQGHGSMAAVHRFMDLDVNEVGYFITQVGLAAASFGVTSDDITGVADALNSLFGYKCAPAVTVIPAQGLELESICLNDNCPLAPNATCALYPTEFMPANITAGQGPYSNSTVASSASTDGAVAGSNLTSGTVSPSGGAAVGASTTNGATNMAANAFFAVVGVAAAVFAL